MKILYCDPGERYILLSSGNYFSTNFSRYLLDLNFQIH